MTVPATLDHAGIAARVPHAGSMCLLRQLHAWDEQRIHCSAQDHTAADHPLRVGGRLASVNGIEIAAQAMALHAALCAAKAAAADPATSADRPPAAGFLASARGVQLHVDWLCDAPGPLQVQAERLAGDERQAMYRFALHSAPGQVLVEGRITVVLTSGLPEPLTA